MNTKSLLDQLLRSGTDLLQDKSDHRKPSKLGSNHSKQNLNEDLLGNLSTAISGKGGAALAGGVLGLLLGSKSGRKIGGKVLTYGGLAVIGTLAYKAYQNHQQQSKNGSKESTKSLTELPQNEVEAHSKVILIAIVAAAKSDGHIDQHEQQMIDSEVAKMTSDQELQSWLKHELNKALDPAEVARYALNESMASEMYLASLLTIDQHSFMEKAYIEELARQLKIPATLKIELEKQAQEALASAAPQL
jgi:uncharacterized membrane protein YebE (DUF533 family)